MKKKVLLILVDGMRPDSIDLCGDSAFGAFFREGTYCLQATTTFPPVTLPCHVSLFHSVDPGRHGTTTNTYMPQVRPVNGLVEVLRSSGKTSAFFYTWEQLRDLSRPGQLEYSYFIRQYTETVSQLEQQLTRAALDLLRESAPDFLFLYLGGADSWGHRKGWMSPEYLDSVRNAWECIRTVSKELPEEYTLMITADHGGHGRSHGEDIPEDMLIPVSIHGPDFPRGKQLEHFDIRDFAPTIAAALGVAPDPEWEGTSLLD